MAYVMFLIGYLVVVGLLIYLAHRAISALASAICGCDESEESTNTIVIKTQAEMDALPASFKNPTRIEIRSTERIFIYKTRENSSIEAYDNSTVEVYSNSSIAAYDNSSIVAWYNSSVKAYNNTYVKAWHNSSIVAYNNSTVVAWNNSSVVARDNSSVKAYSNSYVKAYDNSSVKACSNSFVRARDNSSVEAWDNSSVEARDDSSVVAWDNSTVEARDDSSVVARDNSFVEARENSSIAAYQFSMIAVFTATVVIKHLADYAVASLRDVKPEIKKKDDTATVVETPCKRDLKIPFETWIERGYVHADGIYQKFVSRKKIGEVEVFTVQNFPEKTESFVVRKGNVFSHGETIEQAIEDLRYKIGNRDTSKFKNWDMDTTISIDEAIASYRAITGACETGTKYFCSRIELPEKITVREVIEKTAGQYGNEQYRKFFEAKETLPKGGK